MFAWDQIPPSLLAAVKVFFITIIVFVLSSGRVQARTRADKGLYYAGIEVVLKK